MDGIDFLFEEPVRPTSCIHQIEGKNKISQEFSSPSSVFERIGFEFIFLRRVNCAEMRIIP